MTSIIKQAIRITMHIKQIWRDASRLPCPLCQSLDTLRISAFTELEAVAWSNGYSDVGSDLCDFEIDPMRVIRCRECSVTLNLEEGENNLWHLVPEQKPAGEKEDKKA